MADEKDLQGQNLTGQWTIWCDGSAVPNPGRMGVGAVLKAPDGRIFELSRALAIRGCNNEAEIHALLAALEMAAGLGVRRLLIHSDSDNLIRLTQTAGTGEALRLEPLLARARFKLSQFDDHELRWLSQQKNTQADGLARSALGLPPRMPAKPSRRRRR